MLEEAATALSSMFFFVSNGMAGRTMHDAAVGLGALRLQLLLLLLTISGGWGCA